MRLIICIGNIARGDDAVGWRVAAALEGRLPADVRLLRVHQLDVVLAEDVAHAASVVFVDAERRDLPAVARQPVYEGTTSVGAHGLDPAGLLGLARGLFGQAPPAELVTVAAPEMAHDEALSPIAVASVQQAAEEILDGLRDSG